MIKCIIYILLISFFIYSNELSLLNDIPFIDSFSILFAYLSPITLKKITPIKIPDCLFDADLSIFTGHIHVSQMNLSIDQFTPDSLRLTLIDNNNFHIALGNFRSTGHLRADFIFGFVSFTEEIDFHINDISLNATITLDYKSYQGVVDVVAFTISRDCNFDFSFASLSEFNESFIVEIKPYYLNALADVVEKTLRVMIRDISALMSLNSEMTTK